MLKTSRYGVIQISIIPYLAIFSYLLLHLFGLPTISTYLLPDMFQHSEVEKMIITNNFTNKNLLQTFAVWKRLQDAKNIATLGG